MPLLVAAHDLAQVLRVPEQALLLHRLEDSAPAVLPRRIAGRDLIERQRRRGAALRLRLEPRAGDLLLTGRETRTPSGLFRLRRRRESDAEQHACEQRGSD